MTHTDRVAHTIAAFESVMDRLLTRLESVSAAEAVHTPPDGGWSLAGITWHVAVANEGFTALVDGSRPLAREPKADFVETPFAEIISSVPDQLEAPEVFHPPADVTMGTALERLKSSRTRFVDAYRALPEARGLWSVKSVLGLITVYQVGDWAVAHVIRHNAQAKRTLGR